ncbi:winged helix-turn-helix domain-containing protein [Modestobacter italicus]|uniref:winged helix-turn-helix domain-containing protein n=1 Tax=Modestobacter italicus (strain DSM 44449 / CECT 9708 / BC 501) TaxID=2732864 RepID=UPI001C97FF7F|nr:transcriptional regulator [Modestobacter italicus]
MTRPLDDFLHTPARLSVMSLLAPAEWVTFAFLRDTIGTSDSALSKQLSALETAGYVEVRKDRSAHRSTSARMTPGGRAAFDAYLTDLEELVARARGTATPAPRAGAASHEGG